MAKNLVDAIAKKNLIKLLQYREGNTEGSKYVKQHCQFTDDLIKRLGLEHELQGHQGCVNCLEWTSDGRILASGSDDTNIILWDPFRHKKLKVVPTNHIGNIFSVKFLGTDNTILASAAGDCRVLVQSLQETQLLDCECHKNRIKRLATSPIEPTLFWSAGEDGLVMQYDLREQHQCSTNKAKLLINYRPPYEVKCVAVNPTKPHYIAVGANDVFVRLYDRRMFKPCPITRLNDEFVHPPKRRRKDKNCVQYYAPGHLAMENSNVTNFRYSATYVSFNKAGSEMLVNMGGEQIYLFDVNHERPVDEVRMPGIAERKRKPNKYKCRCSPESPSFIKNNNNTYKFGVSAEQCACFYMRRAYKCFRRRWMGDLYSAARDYLYVIQNWPDQMTAYIGIIKCLIALKWEEDAQRWYDYLCNVNSQFSVTNQARLIRQGIQNIKINAKEDVDEEVNETERGGFIILDKEEIEKRLDSYDYDLRFLGHCNTTTDIKEVNFLGEDGNYVCAGSDEGIIFIWERKTSSIVTGLFGDVSIVNCVQPHPTACLIASSGIDPVVKLWSPMPEDGTVNTRVVKEVDSIIETNQQRMAMDPFESLLVNMGYQIQGTYINTGIPRLPR